MPATILSLTIVIIIITGTSQCSCIVNGCYETEIEKRVKQNENLVGQSNKWMINFALYVGLLHIDEFQSIAPIDLPVLSLICVLQWNYITRKQYFWNLNEVLNIVSEISEFNFSLFISSLSVH